MRTEKDPWANDPWWNTYPIGGPVSGMDPGAPSSPTGSNPNDRGSTPGGGIPFGNESGGPGSPTGYNGSTTTAPKSGWMDIVKGIFGGGSDTSSTSKYIDWIKLIYGMYKDKNPNKPQFTQPPMSPEQRALYNMYLYNIMSRPQAAPTYNQSTDITNSYAGLKWDAPKASNGQTGYGGSPAAGYQPTPHFTPPTGIPDPTNPNWPYPRP